MRLSALVVALGALASGPLAMLVVWLVAPQPPWTDVGTFAASYHPIQSLPYVLGFALLAGFLSFVIACHAAASPELRGRTRAALVFTGIYALLVLVNYTLQVWIVPRALTQESQWTEGITMANPESFAWLLEMFGYAFLGMAKGLVAPGFAGGGKAAAVRWMLRADAGMSIVGAAATALVDGWVFSSSGMASFFGWNVLVIAAFGLIASSNVGFGPRDRGAAAAPPD